MTKQNIKLLSVAVLALVVAAAVFSVVFQKPTLPEVTYTSLDREKFSTASLQGKVYLVNFWATSCTTCVAEMPEMIKLHQRYQDKPFELLAVAMSYDPPAYVKAFSEKWALPFKVVLDSDGKIAKAFPNVRATPTMFVVDANGKIIKSFVGKVDFEVLDKAISALLA